MYPRWVLLGAGLVCLVMTTAAQSRLMNATSSLLDTFTCTSWSCRYYNAERLKGNKYFYRMGCFCDDLCGFYGDCCHDANLTLQKDLDVSMHNYISCIHDCDVSIDMYFHAVTECPREYSKLEIILLCKMDTSQDRFYGIPATGLKTGLTYRNIYCAQCHDEDAILWQVHGVCLVDNNFVMDDSIKLSDLAAINHRYLNFLPSRNDRFRACQPNLITTCPDSDNPYADACVNASGFQLVYNRNGKVFRNPYCAACNRNEGMLCRNPSKPPCKAQSKPHLPNIILFSYDFSTRQGNVTLYGKKVTDAQLSFNSSCFPFEMFDPFHDECRAVRCEPWKTLFKGSCHNTTNIPLSAEGKETRFTDVIKRHDNSTGVCPSCTGHPAPPAASGGSSFSAVRHSVITICMFLLF